MRPIANFFPVHWHNKEMRETPRRELRYCFVSSLFSFIRLLERGNESGVHGRVAAVSQRVINYPDSFGVARALLSIKAALGRGNFLRAACYSGDHDTSRGYFARHARPFAKRN